MLTKRERRGERKREVKCWWVGEGGFVRKDARLASVRQSKGEETKHRPRNRGFLKEEEM